jgi:hypothetical protein
MSSTVYDFEKCPIFSPPYQGGDQKGVLKERRNNTLLFIKPPFFPLVKGTQIEALFLRSKKYQAFFKIVLQVVNDSNKIKQN